MAPEFVERTGGSSCQSALPTGPADRALPARRKSAAPTGVFRGIPENRRIRELKFMVPGFVERTGGSSCQSALPTGPADRALPVSPAFFVSSLRKNHPSTPPTKTGSGWAVNGGRLPESLKGGLRRRVQKNSIVIAYDGVWWRRGGSNPCPKTQEYDVLRAQSVL